jgi:2-keto-4-pentenoate hydratase/2-oxohepta-3-ene-1,7-dioic acid hydratase in catechol pathway
MPPERMAERVAWIGRAQRPGERRVHCIRVWTDGRAPDDDDVAEEIDDPFALALPERDAGTDADAGVLARTIAPAPAGLRAPLRDLRLAPPLRPGKIVCVGRNYAAHARELGHEIPSEPLLFFKPSSALLAAGAPVVLPRGYERIDMEAELCVVIGRSGRDLDPAHALDVVAGYTLGNDVSNRDLQKRDKQWARAKGFDGAAPLGPLVRIVEPGEAPPPGARIHGRIDGELRQDAPLSDMLFDVATVLAFTSATMTLEPGDVVYTGTPEGVSPLAPGAVAEVELHGFELGRLRNPIA